MILDILAVTLALTVTAAPQPKHSEGLIVIYNHQWMIQANADWHSYTLDPYPNRCGISAISPAMLGKIAWVRVDSSGEWDGPCVVIDAVSSQDAIDSIEGRHEISEVSYGQALRLDPTWVNGGRYGEVYFDECPPDDRMRPMPEPYTLTRDYTQWPYRWSSFYPYPQQEYPDDICN